MYRSSQHKKFYALVVEPGTYYFTLLFRSDHKSGTLVFDVFEFISETVLYEKLTIIGTDETALLTGNFHGFIYSLQELLETPL